MRIIKLNVKNHMLHLGENTLINICPPNVVRHFDWPLRPLNSYINAAEQEDVKGNSTLPTLYMRAVQRYVRSIATYFNELQYALLTAQEHGFIDADVTHVELPDDGGYLAIE